MRMLAPEPRPASASTAKQSTPQNHTANCENREDNVSWKNAVKKEFKDSLERPGTPGGARARRARRERTLTLQKIKLAVFQL